MQDLSICLIQADLYWQNIEANLNTFEEKIWEIEEPADLIVLPEMFNTGFTMQPKGLGEPMNSRTFRWMKQMAAQTQAVITGSYIVQEKGEYYNRLIWMRPDGSFEQYDKRHLFRMAGEDEQYSAGGQRLIVELKGWKVCPLVCYDLRFPVWSRNFSEQDDLPYDLLIYVANWPEPRVNAWDKLLEARAIENLCYVAAVNRVGVDGNEVPYCGSSAMIDFKGEVLFRVRDVESISRHEISAAALEAFREKFPAHLDQDRFRVE
ncbi:MAG: amidohydrolase [Cyclobacteriaceae bacterium]|nr:amidohydrolase [Cyclobacteriaceae bacterium]MCH8516899.1 amidohydrolase [Cyclobacteriaceae bacterium]